AFIALAPHDVAEPGLALALSPRVHSVAEGAAAAADRWDSPDLVLRILKQPREHLEARAAKSLGDFLYDNGVTQVRLIAAIFANRLGKGNAGPVLGHRFAVGKLLEHAADHRLHRGKDVVLRDKAHLDVKLVELAWQAVGARILVAETGR